MGNDDDIGIALRLSCILEKMNIIDMGHIHLIAVWWQRRLREEGFE